MTCDFSKPASWPWFLLEGGFYFALFFEPWGPLFRYFGWLFCLVGLAWAFSTREKLIERPVLDLAARRILLFAFFWSILSTLLNFENMYHVVKGLSVPLEAAFGLWIAASVVTKSGVKRFENVWWASSALVFFWTVAVVVTMGKSSQPLHEVSALRLYANMLGLYAVVTLPMSLSLIVRSYDSNVKLVSSWLLLLGNFAALFLSFSSGAWLVATIEVFFFILLVRPKPLNVIKGTAVVVVVTALAFSTVALTNEHLLNWTSHEIRQLSSFGKDVSSFTSKRTDIWKATLDLAMEKPVTGWSWTDFEVIFERERGVLPALGRVPNEPHNTYLDLLLAGGVPLLMAGMALLLAGAWRAWSKFRSSEGDARYLYAAVLTVILGVMLHGMGGSLFCARHKVGFLFWALFGIAVTRGRDTPVNGAEDSASLSDENKGPESQ